MEECSRQKEKEKSEATSVWNDEAPLSEATDEKLAVLIPNADAEHRLNARGLSTMELRGEWNWNFSQIKLSIERKFRDVLD